MVNSHEVLAIAQIVFYAPTALVTHYVGIRAWKTGLRSAWYFSMAFSLGNKAIFGTQLCSLSISNKLVLVRLIGGAMVLATYHDLSNRGLIIGAIVLTNLGLVPLIMPFRVFIRLV
jgi:hypothetical protein